MFDFKSFPTVQLLVVEAVLSLKPTVKMLKAEVYFLFNPGSTNGVQQTPTKYIQSHYVNTIGIDMP